MLFHLLQQPPVANPVPPVVATLRQQRAYRTIGTYFVAVLYPACRRLTPCDTTIAGTGDTMPGQVLLPVIDRLQQPGIDVKTMGSKMPQSSPGDQHSCKKQPNQSRDNSAGTQAGNAPDLRVHKLQNKTYTSVHTRTQATRKTVDLRDPHVHNFSMPASRQHTHIHPHLRRTHVCAFVHSLVSFSGCVFLIMITHQDKEPLPACHM